jgi:uncharacterized membrane protein YidH (DUF202 family)
LPFLRTLSISGANMHQLQMQAARQGMVTIVFSPPSAQQNNTNLIVIAVVAVLIGLIIAAAIAWLFTRNRSRERRGQEHHNVHAMQAIPPPVFPHLLSPWTWIVLVLYMGP